MSRAVLALPGRGSFTADALGTPDEAAATLATALDERRAEVGLLPLVELITARVFVPAIHLRPANVAPLIYLASLRAASEIADGHDVVAVVGNGLGWCTALAVAGAIDPVTGLRLVQEIGIAQDPATPRDTAHEEHPGSAAVTDGGQVLYPMTDADWRPIRDRERTVATVLAALAGEAWLSIELGPYAVLAATDDGMRELLSALPPIALGGRAYPQRLALSRPDHTPLAAPVASALEKRAATMEVRAPGTTLIDGRGIRHAPWSTDPAELRDYTLGAWPVTTYRFATGMRVALREYAPELILLPGPGTTLAGIVGAIAVGEGYRGIRERSAFEAMQSSERPLIVTRP